MPISTMSSDASDNLELAIGNQYGRANVQITSSGMAAISTLIAALHLDHIGEYYSLVYADEIYDETLHVFLAFSKYYWPELELIKYPVTEYANLENFFESNLSGKKVILYAESCSNPNGYILDFEIIGNLRLLTNDLIVIIDNTWLSSVIFNPLIWADYCVISLTKYYSGGNSIGGAIVTNKPLDNVKYWLEIMGPHVSPISCMIIRNHLDTMVDRITTSSNVTAKIVKRLTTKPLDRIINVIHPLNPNHPSYSLATKFFKKSNKQLLVPSIIILVLDIDIKILQKNISNAKIDVKTSYGSKKMRIDPGFENTDEKYVTIRLAIGYDNTYDEIMTVIEAILMLPSH